MTRETDLPYDRTMLSKNLSKAPDAIRSLQSLENNGIVIVGESNVTNINYASKKI